MYCETIILIVTEYTRTEIIIKNRYKTITGDDKKYPKPLISKVQDTVFVIR